MPPMTATPITPNNSARKRKHPFARDAYRLRNLIERTFSRLKDSRRIASRHNNLVQNFRAAVIMASIIAYWL